MSQAQDLVVVSTSSKSSSEIIHCIEHLCYNIVMKLNLHQYPKLKIYKRQYDYVNEKDREKIVMYVNLLSTIHRLLTTKSFMNKREIYYSNVQLFKHQYISDKLIDNIQKHFNVDRQQLGIVASSKGLIAGNVKLVNNNGVLIDCVQFQRGLLIPDQIEKIQIIQTDLQFVLIVEKDTVFQHLIDEGLFVKYPKCCLVTGRGYPDHNTRQFLLHLSLLYPDVPFYALMDCDIHGIAILSTYKYSITATTDDAMKPSSLKNLHWLGIWPEEIVDQQTIQSITNEREKGMIKQFMKRPYLLETWLKQLKILDQIQKKLEIESIYDQDKQYMTQIYIPKKLIAGNWL